MLNSQVALEGSKAEAQELQAQLQAQAASKAALQELVQKVCRALCAVLFRLCDAALAEREQQGLNCMHISTCPGKKSNSEWPPIFCSC